jgi:hypothetical protein
MPDTVPAETTGGRTGGWALSFTSTDTSGSAALNQWFHNRKPGASPIKATGGKTYEVSFRYQLEDYVPGTRVGAYAFVYSRSGGTLAGTEQRGRLPKGNTPAG